MTPETAVVMSFTVTSIAGVKMPNLKTSILNPTLNAMRGAFPTLPRPLAPNVRPIVLTEIEGENGPLGAAINGLPYMASTTENVTQGSTEDWTLINLTVDSHPIHTHLSAHQLVFRQTFDVEGYKAAWLALNK